MGSNSNAYCIMNTEQTSENVFTYMINFLDELLCIEAYNPMITWYYEVT